ncbi:SARP family transcriptional regulator [Saccharomonospora piscinae]|uniref:SARP family transcriptional regulator n=1 Tax=Saccharomonospora piscinae TaxID=687388 RepID=A0A1V9A998_SACPI|nr:BTAD domain-containing putative transcriptional regulator [Saccharomonospora piscinae]OQO93707.1 SARP family transcriptional regulator [Saccharomonospora piscinae]
MTEIRFRLLGPLTVDIDGHDVALGGPKPRLLLAALLLEANTPVSTDTLIDVVWPAEAPRSAAANLRTYIHSLRRALAQDRLERGPSGYRIRVARHELDSAVFADHVTAARDAMARDDPATALDELAAAESQWRGDPLPDLPHHHTWEPALTRLVELRLSARELRVRARFSLGEHRAAIPELRELVAGHPLREELWAQLVVALDRCGRRAEALDAYHEAERVLREELDAAPGRTLNAAGAALASPAAPPPPRRAPAGGRTLCQLPLDLPDLTGREAEIAELTALARRRRSANAPTVVVLSGQPGVGKSSLAVHVAHQLRGDFPDGHLHVDLAGTSTEPRSPHDVLAELLRSLGTPESALPPTEAERAAALRSALSAVSLCLVFDDAASAAQVRPLLPGAGTSAVIVTTRARLPDLTGVHHLGLDVLGPDAARQFFTRLVGARRVAGEPDAADEIVRRCGRLPLALRVAGARLAHRRHLSLALFAERVADERRRLDELRVGELAVRACVELSYARLRPATAAVFRRLGTLGPVSFPSWAADAVLGTDGDEALDELVDAHLVDLVGTDATGSARYRMHDLLRCYATDRADEADHDSVRRMVEGYYTIAATAAARMPVRFFGVTPTPVPDGYWQPPGLDRLVRDPVAWFDAEHATAAALVEWGTRQDADGPAWRLTTALTPYYDLRNRWEDWLRTGQLALEATRRADDPHGEAIVLRDLGQVHVYQDRYREAVELFERAVRLFRTTGDPQGEAVALAGLGTVARIRGERHHALRHSRRALALFTTAGDLYGEAVARIAVGTVQLAEGRLDEAEATFAESYALASAIGDRHRAAHVLQRQALLYRERGRLGAARQRLDQAIAVFDDLGDDHCAGYAQQSLGELCLSSGDLAHAQLLLGNSLAVHRGSGDRRSEAVVSQRLGELHESLGHHAASREYYEQALALWRELAASPQQSVVEQRLARDA